MHPYAADGSAYMEYGRDRGVHDDLSLPDLLDTFRSVYGEGLFAGTQARNADAFTPPA